MLAIRLPNELEDRLSNLAKLTGRTKTYYVKEAILEYIDKLEMLYSSEQRLLNVGMGKEKILTSEEFWDDLDN